MLVVYHDEHADEDEVMLVLEERYEVAPSFIWFDLEVEFRWYFGNIHHKIRRLTDQIHSEMFSCTWNTLRGSALRVFSNAPSNCRATRTFYYKSNIHEVDRL